MQEQQPGHVITPGSPGLSPPPQQSQSATEPQTATSDMPEPQTMPSLVETAVPHGTSVARDDAIPLSEPVVASPEYSAAYETGGEAIPENLQWTAAEYIHHEKNTTWYGAYALGAIVLAVLLFLITRDIVSTGIVVIAIAGLLVLSSREPKQQTYALNEEYIQAGNKQYLLHDFKAFSVDEESPVLGITLLPMKRFMPPITLYIDEAHEQAVVDYMADFLPMEPHKVDAMDRLLKRLRF